MILPLRLSLINYLAGTGLTKPRVVDCLSMDFVFSKDLASTHSMGNLFVQAEATQQGGAQAGRASSSREVPWRRCCAAAPTVGTARIGTKPPIEVHVHSIVEVELQSQ